MERDLIELRVAWHDARSDLERVILDALVASGKDPARLVPADLTPVDEFLAVLLAEFRRARAAAQRYKDLRYRSACYEGIALAQLSPRIFEEFYRDSEDAAVVVHRNAGVRSPSGHRRAVTASA